MGIRAKNNLRIPRSSLCLRTAGVNNTVTSPPRYHHNDYIYCSRKPIFIPDPVIAVQRVNEHQKLKRFIQQRREELKRWHFHTIYTPLIYN